MEKILIKITLIGIYWLLVSAEAQKQIYFPGESLPSESPGIDSRIEVATKDEGGVVESPKFGEDWICGFEHRYLLRQSGIMKLRKGIPEIPPVYNNETHFFSNKDYYIPGVNSYPPVYYLNETAEKLAEEGFKIQVNKVGFGDVLCNFTFSNGTYEDTLAYETIRYITPVGGEPANVTRAYYMAQIGEKKDGKINWLCDGVLINHRWILTAAHCFTERGVDPNIVRLGNLDKSEFKDPPLDRSHEFIRDYPIEQLVPYPDFNVNQRYHDIVLIQIPRPIPRHAGTIFPICLPWDTETNKDLVGMNVTLTGWGATVYRGPKTTRLQEVNLTVFETSVCDEAYADVPVNRLRYPQGITKDKLLCVGWKEGKKDACGGDSGAPLVYLKQIFSDDFDPSRIEKRIKLKAGNNCDEPNFETGFSLHLQKRKFVLAGIVSGGFGCGLKEFPGIYIPINKPMYLKWIKEVAFKDYV